jgi:hypothetical protein
MEGWNLWTVHRLLHGAYIVQHPRRARLSSVHGQDHRARSTTTECSSGEGDGCDHAKLMLHGACGVAVRSRVRGLAVGVPSARPCGQPGSSSLIARSMAVRGGSWLEFEVSGGESRTKWDVAIGTVRGCSTLRGMQVPGLDARGVEAN